jgi:hypothetical protein
MFERINNFPKKHLNPESLSKGLGWHCNDTCRKVTETDRKVTEPDVILAKCFIIRQKIERHTKLIIKRTGN